mmetsp:Transcript_119887/g.346393  ORF Transcript_119887/g.346393 Transcript_119887/m.346393 type:complete len:508 (-) Transcript_119887:8685-10208(-)
MIGDDKAIVKFLREAKYEEGDHARSTLYKTTVIPATMLKPKKKHKFPVTQFGAMDGEDVEALLKTVQQFKRWAEAEGLWNLPYTHDARDLFVEFGMCLTGKAEIQWNEISQRYVQKHYSKFKEALSEFIVDKVLTNHQAYLEQKEYMLHRMMPKEMTFQEYWKRLQVMNGYLPWLLNEDQVISIEDIGGPQFERRDKANAYLWAINVKTGQLYGSFSKKELVSEIALRAIPKRYKNKFDLTGKTALSEPDEILNMLTKIDEQDREEQQVKQRLKSWQPQANRGGGRRSQRYSAQRPQQQGRPYQGYHQGYQPHGQGWNQNLGQQQPNYQGYSRYQASGNQQRWSNQGGRYGGRQGYSSRGGRGRNNHGGRGRNGRGEQQARQEQYQVEEAAYQDAIQTSEELHFMQLQEREAEAYYQGPAIASGAMDRYWYPQGHDEENEVDDEDQEFDEQEESEWLPEFQDSHQYVRRTGRARRDGGDRDDEYYYHQELIEDANEEYWPSEDNADY